MGRRKFLTKKLVCESNYCNYFCKYELVDLPYTVIGDFEKATAEEVRNGMTWYNSIEDNVDGTLTIAIDMCGDLERLLAKYNFRTIEQLDMYLAKKFKKKIGI